MAVIGKSQPHVSAQSHSFITFFSVRRMVSRSTFSPLKHAERAEHRRVVAIALGKGLRAIFVREINAVL